MSLDSIVIGCTWEATITVNPTNGRTDDDVTVDLTGASVAARLHKAGVYVAPLGTAVDAPTRTVGLSLTAGASGALAAMSGCVIDLRVTTSDGRVLPIVLRTTVDVRALTDG